jgi:hypothetical protein
MRKIRLDVDQLAVESFDTADGRGKQAGTVHGQSDEFTEFDGCNSQYSNCATCEYGCPQDTVTCFASCRMTDGYNICINC